jgi:hypothetical protein
MESYEVATMFIFFAGLLIGIGIVFALLAAIVYYFEGQL